DRACGDCPRSVCEWTSTVVVDTGSKVYRVSLDGAPASDRDVSHQAAAATQQIPRRKPPSTSEGQWACRTMRAQPTASMKHTASATTPHRCHRLSRSRLAT